MPRRDHSHAVGGTDTPSGPGPDALRRALRGPPGRVALRLGGPIPPAHRRVAIALLEEVGRSSGGAVLDSAEGDLVLTEAAAVDAARLARQLEGLFGTTPELLDLPGAVAALLALPGLARAAAGMAASPAASGIEGLADAVPLPALLRRHGVLHLAAGQPQRLALLRLCLPAAALAPHLAAAAADADLTRHARQLLCRRLLAGLADPLRRDALLGGMPAVPLLIDLPLTLLPDPPEAVEVDDGGLASALFAALSPAEALAEGLAQRRPALRRAGWGLAVRGLDAAALALIAPEALPADLLLLRWSPALAGRVPAGALRRVDPARLVLTGCDGAALEWGMAMGIARFAGPAIDALLAARRMAACPAARGCTRSACSARGQAASPEGRAGCGVPSLLAALLPADTTP